ncbi:FUSC family protein [Clostridium algidicarnis]|nr:FUSC family protein [Clostridium algidicarnis]MBB6631469.1 FUSC family protein [Clostridium algidicarnis]MBB6697896.1 FUSC family protein [Clostridium algidicarnis]MBU3196265.1 FUSC family protein [Clostridium algidicarnis]MBU3207197.1 FUSC family protein [Clostridium algidicarnis]MBU3209404.1 FUSC family protein [Clostridium algidicarnis]
MSFYEAMQLGAVNLKPLIKDTEDNKLKKRYIVALIVKNFLCLLFCMIVVTFFNNVFGSDNSIVGVVTVIALLTFRFSNLDFKTTQSTIAILGIFAIFIVSPYLASIVHPVLASIINFISMMAIVILSCHNVTLSNQSTLVLSYLLLYGYHVDDVNGYINRIFALILGGIIVSGIFYYKHIKVNFENSFSDIIKDIDFSKPRTKWQLKLVLGITIIILIGELVNLPRVIWAGFAFMSVMQPDKEKIQYRVKRRCPFTIIGSLMFVALYLVIPEGYKGYVGIIGGLMVGASGMYTWQTSFNCFGALSAAVPIFGLHWAIVIRIVDNIIGVVYGKVYNKIFDKVDEKVFGENTIMGVG